MFSFFFWTIILDLFHVFAINNYNNINVSSNAEILTENLNQQQGISSSIRSITSDTAQSFSVSPINPLIIENPQNIYEDNTTLKKSIITNAYFILPAYSVSIVTIDLRFISDTGYNISYGTDWEIIFSISNTSSTGSSYTVSLPSDFRNALDKFRTQEFIITAREYLNFSVKINIYNQTLTNIRYFLYNSTSVETVQPYRAIYGQPVAFTAVYFASQSITLPLNLPIFQDLSYYLFMIDYGSTRNNDIELEAHQLKKDENYFNPPSLYFGNRDSVTMPYLPFFSNCKGYGKHIPIFTLFEQHPNCTLVSIENTIPVLEFDFGKNPIADHCENIIIECIYDEASSSNLNKGNRWFEDQDSIIFYISSDPFNAEDMNTFTERSPNDFIPVSVNANFEDDKWPTTIKIDFHYFQMSKTRKRLLQANATFDNFVVLTAEQMNQTSPVPYTIYINFRPMSHTELLIAFAYDWSVYMVLYFVIGISALGIIAMFLGYHWLVSRKKVKERFKFKFSPYFVLVVPAALRGMALALIPVSIFVILTSILMTGTFWGNKFYSCSTSDPTCYESIFDLYTIPDLGLFDITSTGFDDLRSGRTGTALLIGGIFLIYKSSLLLIRERKMREDTRLDAGTGFWNTFNWKRSSLLICNFLFLIWHVYILQFSFSSAYSESLLYYLSMFKACGMILEPVMDYFFKDKLLVIAVSAFQGVMESVITFGASDFLAFLESIFVDLAFQMIEKTYVAYIVDKLAEYVESKSKKWFKMLNMIWNPTYEVSQKKNKSNAEERDDMGKFKINSGLSSSSDESDSNVILTEDIDDALDSSIEESIGVLNPNQKINTEDFDEVDLQDEFEKELKIKLADREKKHHHHRHHIKNDIKKDDEITDINDTIDKYTDFANQICGTIFAPYFIFLMWVFYSQTQIGDGYSIAEEYYIYYFLFSIVFIPFQMIIDILFYNNSKIFHDYDFFALLEKLNLRFVNRKNLWKADDDDKNPQIESELQVLEQLGFSSQFYFLVALFTSGSTLILLGIQTIIASNYYTISDPGLKCVAGTILILCWILSSVFKFLGAKLKIWKVKVNVNEEINIQEEIKLEKEKPNHKIKPLNIADIPMTPISVERELMLNSKNSTQGDNFIENQSKIAVPILKWDRVLKIQEHEERLKELRNELEAEKFKSEAFCNEFIQVNNQWIKMNLKEIFTPRVLKEKKTDIISSFKDIFGPIAAVTSIDENTNVHKTEAALDNKEKKRMKKSLPTSFIGLLTYWKLRAQRIRKARSQIAGYIEQATQKECQYCKSNWGLRAEPLENIENTFIKFLQSEYSIPYLAGDISVWQEYFKKTTPLRTLCFKCTEIILDHHRKISQKPLSSIREIVFAKLKQSRNLKVHSESKVATEIVKYWRAKAKENLANKN